MNVSNKHTQLLNRVLTIDVGDNTGWAYWVSTCEFNGKYPIPHSYGQYSHKESDIVENDLNFMAGEFEDLIGGFSEGVKLVILEGVELWGDSLRSLTSARRGNLFKLAYMVGMYANICRQHGIEFRIVPARQWKGQMNNDMVSGRVTRMTGIKVKKKFQHMVDAIGIGLSTMGYWEVGGHRIQRTKRYKIG